MKLTRKKELILLAAGIVAIIGVLLLCRPGWIKTLPKEFSLPSVVPDDMPVSFPDVNKWEVPLEPSERGYYCRKGSVTVFSDGLVKKHRDSSIVFLTIQDYQDLLELMNMPDYEVKTFLPQNPYDLDFWPLRIQAAIQQKAPDKSKIFWEHLYYFKRFRPNEKPRTERMTTLGYLSKISYPLVEGTKIKTGKSNECLYKIVSKETVYFSGKLFRCWRIEINVDYGDYKYKEMIWYAPGIGELLSISRHDYTAITAKPEDWKKYLPRKEDISWNSTYLKEVMIPSKNFYWKAQDESPAK